MADVLLATTEPLGVRRGGQGIRVIGLAEALAARGHQVVVAAPAGAVAVAGCTVATLDDLPVLVASADAAIIAAPLLDVLPAVRSARALCVDLAGPYLIESFARARARSPAERRSIARHEAAAVVAAVAAADAVLCAHARQRDLICGFLLASGSLDPGTLDADRDLRATILEVPFAPPVVAAGARPAAAPSADGPLQAIWPGGMWEWLDPGSAIAGVEAARADGVPVELELWGASHPDGSAPTATAARVRERAAGLGDAVRIVDWVEASAADARITAADVAITLDDAGLEARYAFRTRLLHALALGVPVIATAGEWVADAAAAAGAGWVVPPGDPAAVAALLARLHADPAERAAARRRTVPFAARFAYAQTIEPLDRWCTAPLPRARNVAPPPRFRRRLAALLRG